MPTRSTGYSTVAIFYSFAPITMDGGAITWMRGLCRVRRSGDREVRRWAACFYDERVSDVGEQPLVMSPQRTLVRPSRAYALTRVRKTWMPATSAGMMKVIPCHRNPL